MHGHKLPIYIPIFQKFRHDILSICLKGINSFTTLIWRLGLKTLGNKILLSDTRSSFSTSGDWLTNHVLMPLSSLNYFLCTLRPTMHTFSLKIEPLVRVAGPLLTHDFSQKQFCLGPPQICWRTPLMDYKYAWKISQLIMQLLHGSRAVSSQKT